MNIGREISGFSITPLLLIPFIENAFKHISHHPDRRNFVRVDLSRDNGIFRFEVENSREDERGPAGTTGGIGLNNVKRRLALLYPEKHELKIFDNDATFKVSLTLHLS
jgi:LytS/YehU family sensor histidine kinase